MKNVKIILAYIMAVSMIFGMLTVVSAGEEPDGTYTIAEFNNQDTITEWGLTPDNEIHSLYDMSAKWVCADKGATTYMRAEDGKVPSDWSGYGYLNLWIHAPEVYNAKINVLVYTTEKNASNVQKYHRYYLKVDWTGWKQVSIPLSLFEFSNKDSGETNATWTAPIEFLGLNVSGWPDPKYEDYTKMVLNMDKVWLSAERPEQPETPDTLMLADFSDPAQTQGWTGISNSSEQTYQGAANAAKWANHEVKDNWYMISPELSGEKTDWRSYDKLCFNAYSAAATGETIHVLVQSRVGTNATWNGYYRVPIKADWTGWKTIEISADALKKTEAYGASWADIMKIHFRAEGWGATPVAGTTLYFDKIWLAKNTAPAADTFTIAQFDNEQVIQEWGFTPDAQQSHLYNVSAKWDCEKVGSTAVRTSEAGQIPSNWKDYGYLNLWVYSPKVMNSKVNILVYTNEKDGNGKDIYLRQFLKVDWTGWKLLSFPLAGFTAAYGATWDMPIHNFSIKSTGWNDASYEPIAGTVLNLDKIWLSKTQEGLPDVGENTGEEDDSSKAEGSVILADFDQGTQDWQSVTEDKIIYRGYRGAAQSGKWENHPANTATRSPNLTLNDWSDFETLNFWIYSAKATGETVHFLLFSDYDEANKKDSYFRDTFVVDWVGWKKITLDLNSDKVQRAYNPRLENIRYVQLQAAGWNTSAVEGTVLNLDLLWLAKLDIGGNTGEEDDTSEAEGSYIVGDFDDTQVTANWSGLAPSQEYARSYRGAANSAAWLNHTQNKIIRSAEFTENKDWSGYDSINLWVFSKRATDETIHFCLYSTYSEADKRDSYLRATFKVDWVGWKNIKINLKGFSGAYGATLSNIRYVQMESGGWGTSAVDGTELYFDLMWLSMPGQEPQSDNFIISRFDNDKEIADYKFVKDTDIKKQFDSSAKWVCKDLAGSTAQTSASGKIPSDWSKYGYLNMWVYLDKAYGSKINVLVYTDQTDDASGRERYFVKKLRLDWQGWKLVSIPFEGADGFESGYSPSWDMNITRFSFDGAGWADSSLPDYKIATLNFDSIWLSKEAPAAPSFVSSNLPSDCVDVPVLGTQINMEFSAELGQKQAADVVTVKKADGTPVTGVKTSVKGNQLQISFDNQLEYEQTYKIAVSGQLSDAFGQQMATPVELSFTTAGRDIYTDKVVLKNSAGIELKNLPKKGRVVASANAYNASAEDKKAMLVIGVYDSSNQMLAMNSSMPMEVGVGAQARLEASVELDSYEGCTVMAYVIDSMESQYPLRQDVTWLSKAGSDIPNVLGVANTKIAALSVAPAQVNLNTVTLSGSVSEKRQQLLSLVITDSAGKVNYAAPVYTNQDGSFSYSFDLDVERMNGEYKILLNGRSLSGNAVQSFYFVGAQQREEILNKINAAGTTDAMKTVLKDYAKALDAGGTLFSDSTALENTARTLVEQRPFASYEAAVQMMQAVPQVLKKINDSDWSALSVVLQENEKILMVGIDTDYTYYKALSPTNQNTINKTIKDNTEFRNFAVFRTAFVGAVNQYKENSGKPSGGGGGSGGSGGGGTPGSSYEIAPTPTATPTPTPDAAFDDLGSVEWAKDSIQSLYEQNIISPAADKKFRPQQAITREEFIKLLVGCLDILGAGDKKETCKFKDVSEGDWFYPSIAAAAGWGITQGREDGSFGVGENITRQDMAVMVYRAMEVLGKSLPEVIEREEFSDDGAIADYAKEAVYQMQTAQIISGVGNGAFAPQQQADRAQAAKIIDGLLKAVQ